MVFLIRPLGPAQAPPVTLHVGTNDFSDRPAVLQIEEFKRNLERLSEGRIRVEVVTEAGDGRDWDQDVARKVADGELDLGMVPSRAFASFGVTSLQALTAPFLITDDAVMDDVSTSNLADDLMSGLDEAGWVGLTLIPEAMRHPFAAGDAHPIWVLRLRGVACLPVSWWTTRDAQILARHAGCARSYCGAVP